MSYVILHIFFCLSESPNIWSNSVIIFAVIAIFIGATVIYLAEIYLNLIKQGARQIQMLFNVIKFKAE